jgi:hypothetical protein
VTISATTGSFDVVFSVTPNAAGALNNPARICRVDPSGNVWEDDETNNDCADNVNVVGPDLQVNKANDTGGNGTIGVAFNWTLTISNTDTGDATFNAGQRILEDNLPAGPTYGAPAAGNFTNVTNSGNINCAIAANALTCDAIGANVTISATTGSFDVVFSVTPNAAGALNNPARIGKTTRPTTTAPITSLSRLAVVVVAATMTMSQRLLRHRPRPRPRSSTAGPGGLSCRRGPHATSLRGNGARLRWASLCQPPAPSATWATRLT